MPFNKNKDQNTNRFLNSSANYNFSGKSETKKRTTPLGIIIAIFFSDVLSIIAVAFTLMGSLFLVIFGSLLFDSSSLKISDDDPFASAVIQEISPTNTTVNEQTIYKYTYTYKAEDSKEYTGSDKQFIDSNSPGDTVVIQYAASDPTVSMIIKNEDAEIPVWIFLFLCIFPLMGIIFLIIGIRKVKRKITIINSGETAWGTFKRQEATGSSVNKQTVYRLFFTFTAHNGKEYIAKGETHKTYRLKDEDRELVIYNPSDPSQAFPVDAYPPSVKKFILDN